MALLIECPYNLLKMGLVQGFIILLIFSLLACGPANQFRSHSQDHVAEGLPTDVSDPLSPFIVHLRTYYVETPRQLVGKCSGVLLAPNLVLTAAHCLDYKILQKIEVVNHAGEIRLVDAKNPGLIHPEHDAERASRNFSALRDISVLRLESGFDSFKQNLIEFSAPTSTLPVPVNFYGYGQIRGSFLNKDNSPPILRNKLLVIKKYNVDDPYFVINQESGGICLGDSGGPAFIQQNGQAQLLGIAIDILFNPSKAFEPDYEPCHQQAVFLNLAYFKPWLLLVLDKLKTK